MRFQNLLGVEVENGEGVVARAGDERQPLRRIETDTVGLLEAGESVASRNLGRGRIDGYQFRRFMDGDQNLLGTAVVNRISGFPSERDARHECVRAGVDDRVLLAVL